MTLLHAGGKFDHVELQGLGRSARRRRLGRQRALRLAEAGDPPRRQGLLPGVRRGDPGDRVQADIGVTERRGTKITFQPDSEIFKNTEFSFEMLDPEAARARRTSTAASRSPSATSAADKAHEFKFEGGIAPVRRRPQRDQDAGARQADRGPGRGRRDAGRHRDAVERLLLRSRSTASRTTSRTTTAART